jgi:peptide/nickel transport system permease protein
LKAKRLRFLGFVIDGLTRSPRWERILLAWRRAVGVLRILYKNRSGMTGIAILTFFILMGVVGPTVNWWIFPLCNPNDVISNSDPTQILKPPSWEHPLGTDERGIDVLSDLAYGTRNSLIVGFSAALITMVIGTIVGLAAGYYSRMADEILMRTTDMFLVLPWIPLAVILATVLPPQDSPSLWKVIVVIGITSWPMTARMVRSQVLSIKERGFVERAKSIGAGSGHILRRHVLPNVFPLIFANMILSVSVAILSEAFLAYFGLENPQSITWGLMLYHAQFFGGFAHRAFWYILPPGLSIAFVVLGFSLLGYALDDILNPRLRRR